MSADRPTAFEFFNAALEAGRRGELADAVLLLRGAFFENLYIAPLLLGEECHSQRIWHPSAEAGLRAAEEYAERYGRLWKSDGAAMALLREVWGDSLVRSELQSFINVSRNILDARSEKQRSDLLKERELLKNPERLRRTQPGILARLERLELSAPLVPPRLALVMVASRDPSVTVEFYRKLLGIEPRTTSGLARGFAEFEVGEVRVAVHGLDQAASGDPYRLGAAPQCLGWGAIFVFSVRDFERYYRNAAAAGLEILDSDLSSAGRRSFVVKDPSGYLIEITEEEPRGLYVP
ncbi:MAG: VOC family protein [Planctomycetota bacterium]